MTEKNKIYTAADFERYHAGTMPSIEMHELEKAALEDPFLADALEGYTYTPSFENDIAVLHERLSEKRRTKKVFSISSFAQSGWWRIAAIFIIIAGAAYFFYKLNYTNKENILAKNDRKSLPLKQDSALLKTDTNKTTNNVALEKHGLSADSFTAGSKKDYAYNEKNEATERGNYTNTSGKYLLKGRVTNEKGKALAFASVKNNINDKATVTDSAGKFLLPSPDSNTTATISVIGYATKKVVLQKDSQPTIAMYKTESNAGEVAATSLYNKETNSLFNKPGSGGAGSDVNNSPAPSLANNEEFDQYLTKNTQPVYDENNKLLTGEVVLSFAINKKGRPRNIKVIQSSCKGCEKEAIHLLENGPDWSVEKQKWQKVLVKF